MMISRRVHTAWCLATTLSASVIGIQAAHAAQPEKIDSNNTQQGITIVEQGENYWSDKETQIIVTEVPASEVRKAIKRPATTKKQVRKPSKPITTRKTRTKPAKPATRQVTRKSKPPVKACPKPYVVQPVNPVVESELTECLANRTKLLQAKEQAESQQRALQTRVNALNKKMTAIEQQLADEISASNRLQKKVEKQKQQLAASETHIKGLHSNLTKSKHNTSQIARQLHSLTANLGESSRRESELEKSSKMLMDSNLQLTAQLAKSLSELDAYRSHGKALAGSANQARKKNKQLAALTATQNAEIQVLREEVNSLRGELKTMQTHAKSLHSHAAKTNQENLALKEQLTKLSRQPKTQTSTQPQESAEESSARAWIKEYLAQFSSEAGSDFYFDIGEQYQLAASEPGTYNATWDQFSLVADGATVNFAPVKITIFPVIGATDSNPGQRQFSVELNNNIQLTDPTQATIANINIGQQNFTGIWSNQYGLATAQAGVLQNISVNLSDQSNVANIASISYQSNSQVDDQQNWKSPGNFSLAGVKIDLDGQQIVMDEYSVTMDMAGNQFDSLAKVSKSFANLEASANQDEQMAALLEQLFSYFDSYSYQAKLDNLKWQMVLPNTPEPMVLGGVESVQSSGKGGSNESGGAFEQDLQLNGLKLPPNAMPGNFPITDLYLSFSANQLPKGMIKQILSPEFDGNPAVFLSSLEQAQTGLFFAGSARNQDIAEINWKSHGLINSQVEENITGTLTLSVRGIPEIKAALADSLSGEEKLKAEAALTMIDLLGQEQKIDGKTFEVYNFKLDDQQRYYLNGADITALVKSVKARDKQAAQGQQTETAPVEQTEMPPADSQATP